MTILTKGANVRVAASTVHAILDWSTGPDVPDVDASALLVTAAGKVRSDADMVFYNQPAHSSGAVRHAGKHSGTDTVHIDLDRVEPDVDKVVLAASADGGTFGEVRDLRLRLLEPTGETVAEFRMSAADETAFVGGEIYRRDGAWKFRAVGQGYSSGLAGLATDFGIDVGAEEGMRPRRCPCASRSWPPRSRSGGSVASEPGS